MAMRSIASSLDARGVRPVPVVGEGSNLESDLGAGDSRCEPDDDRTPSYPTARAPPM